MSVSTIVSAIDVELSKLNQVRELLVEKSEVTGKKRGRPKSVPEAPVPSARRGGITPEGKLRIAAAMKRRWAVKKAAAKKTVKG